jgi:ribosomal protein S18 acetylase RimI-like enzyme
MQIRAYDSAVGFLADTRSCLELRECENNLPLGIAGRLAARPPSPQAELPLLISINDDRVMVGAAIMTPKRKLILSRIDGDTALAARALVEYLDEEEIPVPGVVGPNREAAAFAERWSTSVHGRQWEINARMRVFECRQVSDLALVDGALRRATQEDVPLAARWDFEFCAAIGEPVDLEESKRSVTGYIDEQSLHFWHTDTPVSMARQTRPTANGIAVNMVYTPPELRGQGHATACVHHLTQRLLGQGYSFCSLYTDLANPTANSIYRKIGYVPVGDAMNLVFSE